MEINKVPQFKLLDPLSQTELELLTVFLHCSSQL